MTGTFDTFIAAKIPFSVAGGDTGTFDVFIAAHLPFNVYAEAAAVGGDASVSVSDSSTVTDTPTVYAEQEPALSVSIGKRALVVEIN